MEISLGHCASVFSAMAKMKVAPKPSEVPEIFLGQWLALFEIGPTEAAKIAGCTQGYISNISAGRKSNINALYLFRLSEEMGVRVNDFFRPLPNGSQVAALKRLSPEAQAAILNRRQKKS